MQERGPQIPDTVLEAFFTACQDTPTLRVDQLGDVQGCDSQTAAVAAVFVLPPAPYIPLFDAEDALADLRAQRTAWQGNVKETEATLHQLDQDIATRKAYGLLSEAHAAEMAEKLADRDHAREVLVRHQSRDFPALHQLLAQEEASVQARLTAAQEAITAAFEAQVDPVEAAWQQEALATLQPVLEVLTRARTIDEAYRLMNKPLHLGGSAQVRGVLLQRLQHG